MTRFCLIAPVFIQRERRDGITMVFGTLKADATEGDVETQVVLPLLTRTEFLGIDRANIKSKEFLAAFDIGKGAKVKKGYIPDFCIYCLSIPIVAIEVKAPTVGVNDAWEEASLYAHAVNKRYETKFNPCEIVLATNGTDYAAGHWDNSQPIHSGKVTDLEVGSDALAKLQALMGATELERLGAISSASLKLVGFKRPFNQGNGPALINSKIEPNTFAADLSPVLRRYFSSRDQNDDPDIYKNAYVSSSEVTSYDRILESFLVDRLSRSKARSEIQTTKKRAEAVSKALSEKVATRYPTGELQLITGGVGTGKSLFARRYKEFLQPHHLASQSHWAFLDFNYAPEDLSEARGWVCSTFARSIVEEGAPINLRDGEDQERIFAADLADREAYYERIDKSVGKGLLEKARDIEGWRQDPERLAHGISRHLQGDRGEVVIVVFDNVDRRDGDDQLSAFQLALWFMRETKSLVILQMRDTTFEIHKNEPPLDTYKTGQIFHISPPRFIDVVKRRLELSLIALEAEAPKKINYDTPGGASVSYPRERAGEFLRSVYLELFQRPTNVSRILEAIAGRDVRKALDMFMAIINSGHMPENLIASVAAGEGIRKFPEHLVLKILMRQDYRFFSEASGFVSNLLYSDGQWERPNNLLVSELLFYLIGQRKVPGDNGQMGFVSVGKLQEKLESFGFVRPDILAAAQYLLANDLLDADKAGASSIELDDCVKASASGWAHMRILSSRSEYLTAILPTTPINDQRFAARIFELLQIENKFGDLNFGQTLGLLDDLHKYLSSQFRELCSHPGYRGDSPTGARYLLKKVDEARSFMRKELGQKTGQADWLDG